MKSKSRKLLFLIFLIPIFFITFLNAEEIGFSYGYHNMYVMKQGKVVIINSLNDEVRVGFVEEGYTMCQIETSGNFVRNKSYQIRDFIGRIEVLMPADIIGKSLIDNSNWYNYPRINNYELYVRLFDEKDSKLHWAVILLDEFGNYEEVVTEPADPYNDDFIELSTTQANFILQLDDVEDFNSYDDISTIKNYNYDLDSTISNTISENVTVPAGYYFTNLKNNFPTNTIGSCGYIATEILLSYYDIFYNSNICPELAYNQNMITSVNTNSYDLRLCLNSPGPSDSFNQMMIDSVAPYAGITSSETDLSLTYNEMVALLNKFMQSFSDYSYNYQVTQLVTMNEILTELDNGRPVILTISDFAINETILVDNNLVDTIHCYYDSGHAVIAYGYEEMSNGDIYFKCHTGFKSNQISNITSGYLKLLSNSCKGISLRLINNIHSHSNSYVYNSSFCPCINNINYSEFSGLDSYEINSVYNNEVWIDKKEEDTI